MLGSSPPPREALNLRAGTLDGVREGMAVLYRHGLVGRIDHAGAGGSQVQLCTDREFAAAAEFRRYVTRADGTTVYESVGKTRPFVRGAGRGMMSIQNIELKETSDAVGNPIKIADMVVLADPDWEQVSGQWLGQVVKIEPLNAARLVANITVRPVSNLAALDEVMVMNKAPGDAAVTASNKNEP